MEVFFWVGTPILCTTGTNCLEALGIDCGVESKKRIRNQMTDDSKFFVVFFTSDHGS